MASHQASVTKFPPRSFVTKFVPKSPITILGVRISPESRRNVCRRAAWVATLDTTKGRRQFAGPRTDTASGSGRRRRGPTVAAEGPHKTSPRCHNGLGVVEASDQAVGDLGLQRSTASEGLLPSR